MKRSCNYLGSILLQCLLLSPVAHAVKAEPVTPAPDMSAVQAQQAILTAADSLLVPVKKRAYQSIDAKSMRVSRKGVDFDNGQHHYTIRFTTFTSVSVICDTDCKVASEPPEILARNESGQAIMDVYFADIHREEGTYKTTCRATCQRTAMRFAAALNSLRKLALAPQAESQGFHEKASDWRALSVKPPLPDDVRVQRLMAEDAVKNNRPAEALNYYEAGLALYPTWPQGCFNAALIASELGFLPDAIEYMQEYLELVPDAKDAQSARDQIAIWQYKTKHDNVLADPQ